MFLEVKGGSLSERDLEMDELDDNIGELKKLLQIISEVKNFFWSNNRFAINFCFICIIPPHVLSAAAR